MESKRADDAHVAPPDYADGGGQLDRPIGIMSMMWNHASIVERELRARNLEWPRLEQGETADLTAYIIAARAAAAAK